MKETITIEVDLKDFCKTKQNENYVIMRKNGKWVCEPVSNILKPITKKIDEMKDIFEGYKIDNQEMKTQKAEMLKAINMFKDVLIQYGFRLFGGEN